MPSLGVVSGKFSRRIEDGEQLVKPESVGSGNRHRMGAIVEGVYVVNVFLGRRRGRCNWRLISCQSYDAMERRRGEGKEWL